jgi:putative ABC transport system permease protein
MMKNRKKSPPYIAKWIISRLSYYEEHALDDAIEAEYFDIRGRHGAILSWVWYWFCTMGTLFQYLKLSLLWSIIMFKNYLKIALRNLKKQKNYSFINIAGLALGMSCSLLVLLFVFHEMSYDKFHENADRIFRIIDVHRESTGTPAILSKVLLEECPEVEKSALLVNFRNTLIKYGDKSFIEKKVLGADASFFGVFSFPLLVGDSETLLSEPHRAVISESAAVKYFGNEGPVGKTITVGDKNFIITGIAADTPENSHFKFDFLLAYQTFERMNRTGWLHNNFKTYVLLREGTKPENLERRFEELAQKYPQIKHRMLKKRFGLQALTDIHLRSDLYYGEFEANSSIAYVYIFFAIAAFILIVACINFMNLSTARSSNRAREVGIRKVVGSKKNQLIGQFLGESLCMSFIALALALLLVQFLLPSYRNLIGKNLEINYFGNYAVLPGLIGLACLVGFLSGLYPALHLSSFRPVEALKVSKSMSMKGKLSFFRSGLVVFQFIISIILLSGTIVIYKQLHYFQNRKLGFMKEQVLVIKNTEFLFHDSQAFKESLLQQATITDVTHSTSLPGKRFSNWGIATAKKKTGIGLNIWRCDYDYLETLKMEMSEGRFFSRDFAADTSAMVINETAVPYLELKEPIGKQIYSYVTRKTYTIIGVVKDFHYESLHERVKPACFVLQAPPMRYVSARINTSNITETLRTVRKEWDSFSTGLVFDYSFLDEDFDNLYRVEQKVGKLAFLFSALAIFISCLGLLGLAAFTAEQRTKEIGIRKVLGASLSGIVVLLSKNFVKWVLFAFIIALPAAYLSMDYWLRNFAYRIALDVWIFVFAGIVALVIALLTVSYQTIKAAAVNPVDLLRYE